MAIRAAPERVVLDVPVIAAATGPRLARVGRERDSLLAGGGFWFSGRGLGCEVDQGAESRLRVPDIGHVCGNLHRAGLTGRLRLGTASQPQRSRKWFRTRDWLGGMEITTRSV